MNTLLREQIYRDTLIPALAAENQSLLRHLIETYDLELEEIKVLSNAARDLEMWRETSLASLWSEWEAQETEDSPNRKARLLHRLEDYLERLRSQEKTYPIDPLRGLTRSKPQLIDRPAPTTVFAPCPYYSDSANCCGLHLIEAVTGCALSCSFCNVNASVGDTVEFARDLETRLLEVRLDPDQFYHVSTSHMSDSLIWGNRHGILDALLVFARRNPNVQLELKTKSDRIDYLLRHKIPENVVCSWWINSDTVIRNEELGSATLRGRLQAARAIRDQGIAIGVHINPMIHYKGWREEYASVVGALMAQFSPDEIEFVSMGALWLTQPIIRGIRSRGGESKVLQMPMDTATDEKLTYPESTRVEMYQAVNRALQPWHGKVFTFLCMEPISVWEAVFGLATPVRDALEKQFRDRMPSARSSRSRSSAA